MRRELLPLWVVPVSVGLGVDVALLIDVSWLAAALSLPLIALLAFLAVVVRQEKRRNAADAVKARHTLGWPTATAVENRDRAGDRS